RVGGARPESRRAKPAELVGRALELADLAAASKALREGSGRFVLLEGEPGIGKTRLLDWLREKLGGEVTWVEGYCASYGGQPLCHAPAEALRAWAGVEDVSGRAATPERLGLEPDAPPYLASPLSRSAAFQGGANGSSAEFDSALAKAYSAWLKGLARERPVVFAVHDMHWADHCTRALVEGLLGLIDDEALMIAVTTRPTPDGNDERLRE